MFAWRITRAFSLVVAAVTSVALLFAGASAHANPARVTEGDAEAVFQAWVNGGWAIRLNGGTVEEGAPANFSFPPFSPTFTTARIAPMAPWNGRHFCSLDWHVIAVAALEGNPVGGTRTNQELIDTLSQTRVLFTLDGAPLDTTTTAIKRTTNPAVGQGGPLGWVEAFSVVLGRVMAPEDLSVGQHTLQALGLRPGSPPIPMGPITFFIDAPEDGTCL